MLQFTCIQTSSTLSCNTAQFISLDYLTLIVCSKDETVTFENHRLKNHTIKINKTVEFLASVEQLSGLMLLY